MHHERAPLLVLGVQRSGTTLIAQLISRHPQVLLSVNGKLLYYLVTWVLRDPAPRPLAHARLDEIRFALERRPILGISDAQRSLLLDAVEGLAELPRNVPTEQWIRSAWWRAYDQVGAASVVGEKYNELLLQIDEVTQVFPDANYLFIHRDPLDVAESMVRHFAQRPWCPESLADAAHKWGEWNRRWLDVRGRIAPERRMELPYEGFVREPKAWLGRVFRWLRLSDVVDDDLIRDVHTDAVGRGARTLRTSSQVFLSSLDALTRQTAEQLARHTETDRD